MKSFLKLFLSLLITVGFVAFLGNQVGFDQLLNLFDHFSWRYAIWGLLFYVLSYLLRCWRWRVLFPQNDINFLDLYSLTSLTIVGQNILPGGTGEISFVVALKKIFKIDYHRGIISMIMVRLFDLVALLFLFLISLFLLLKNKDIDYLWLFLLTVFILAVGCLIIGLDWVTALAINILERFLNKSPKLQGLQQKIITFQENIRQLHQRRVYGKLFVISMVNQLIRYLSLQKMVEAILDRPFSLWSTIYGSTFSEILSKVPVHGFLGLGTFEGGWVGAQILMGMSKEEAVLSAFGQHAVLLIFSALMGGIGIAIMLFRKRERTIAGTT